MNLKKTSLVTLLMAILAGCNGSMFDTSPPDQEQQTATYLDMVDVELQQSDRLVSRAVGSLLTEVLPGTSRELPDKSSVDKVKRATEQIDAVSQVLKARRYPSELPRRIREELLAIRDNTLEAYRIKKKSLAILKKYLIRRDPYLMDEYRRLSQQSSKKQDEAHSRFASLKARFRNPGTGPGVLPR